MELVSIVVPMYNCEKTIVELIDAIKNQTYTNFEAFLVNDGSTDLTETVVQKAIKNDERFVIINQKNSGAPAARNNGISHSKGEYIYLCDADDVITSDCIETLVNTIRSEKTDLVIARYSRFENVISENYSHKELPNSSSILDKVYKAYLHDPIPGTKLYKRSIIERYHIRFADVKIAQDLNFYLKYLNCTNKISDIDSMIYYYRISNGSISRTYKVENLMDIKKSIHDIILFMKNNKICSNYNIKRRCVEYVKMVNYVGQMRKKKHLDRKDYKHLRKDLCCDVMINKYRYKKLDKVLLTKKFEFFLLKYININIKNV